MAEALSARGQVSERSRSAAYALAVLGSGEFSAVVADATECPSTLQRLCQSASAQGVAPFLYGPPPGESMLLRAFRWGVRDFFLAPWADAGPVADRLDGALGQLARERASGTAELQVALSDLRAEHAALRGMVQTHQETVDESRASHNFDLARMMTIIGSIMDGIVFTDRDGRISLLNPVAEDLLGVKAFLVTGKHIEELRGQSELVEPLLEDRGRASEQEITRTIEVHHSEQDLIYIKTVTSRVTDYRGDFAGVLTVLQDVTTDYKSDQLKNQYLSIVAHELRTPLTGIKTFSTMMAKAVLGDLNERQLRAVEAIREQSLQLEHQIDKLINLGYLDSNEYGRDLEVFDVHEFIAAAAAPFERPSADRGIVFEVRCPRDLRLRADRADLKRALQALIENAIKFTPERGEVSVLAQEDDEHVMVSVRDAGIGIDPRYQRRIFEKFFQVEDPLTRHHGGAGLGLFVASQIIKAHESRIEVRSELGMGAEFSFRLPTYAENRASAVAGATAAPAAGGSPRE
ncbi:MAG: ATP-binding protein [Planctomycetota bacterium]